MGMFDWVNFKMQCPNCNTEVTGFQTKDLACTGGMLEPEDVSNFYSSCSMCNTWIEFTRPFPERPMRATPLTLGQVQYLGFEYAVTPSIPSKV